LKRIRTDTVDNLKQTQTPRLYIWQDSILWQAGRRIGSHTSKVKAIQFSLLLESASQL